MGLFFGVEHGTLEAIRGYSNNPDECIRDMLGRVKNGSRNLTWENICKCLREPTVDFAALADDLQARYLEQDIQTVQKGNTMLYGWYYKTCMHQIDMHLHVINITSTLGSLNKSTQ